MILDLRLSSLEISHYIVFSTKSSKNFHIAVGLSDKNPPWHIESSMVLVRWFEPSQVDVDTTVLDCGEDTRPINS